MASDTLLARVVRAFTPNDNHALIPAVQRPIAVAVPKPTPADYAFGVMRWPMLFWGMVKKLDRTLTSNKVEVELADPQMAGRTWSANEATIRLTLPFEAARLIHLDDTILTVAMPADDPRTHETLIAMERIWNH